MWLSLIAVVLAHPFESRLYGHQTTLWLAPEAVTVEYAVEIPTPDLLSEIRASLSAQPTEDDQTAFNERLHRDLRDALRLVIDGEAMSWEQVEPTADSGRGDATFIVYRLLLRAPLPDSARTLQLIDGNYPDEPSIFQTAVLVDEALILDASSQLTVEDGTLISSRDGLWRSEEDNRELRLSFRRRSGVAVWSALAGLGGMEVDLRPSAEVISTRRIDRLAELKASRLSPGTVSRLLLLSGLLGGIGGLRRGLLVGATVVVCGGLVLLGLLPVAGVCLLMMLGGAGIAHGAGKIAAWKG